MNLFLIDIRTAQKSSSVPSLASIPPGSGGGDPMATRMTGGAPSARRRIGTTTRSDDLSGVAPAIVVEDLSLRSPSMCVLPTMTRRLLHRLPHASVSTVAVAVDAAVHVGVVLVVQRKAVGGPCANEVRIIAGFGLVVRVVLLLPAGSLLADLVVVVFFVANVATPPCPVP